MMAEQDPECSEESSQKSTDVEDCISEFQKTLESKSNKELEDILKRKIYIPRLQEELWVFSTEEREAAKQELERREERRLETLRQENLKQYQLEISEKRKEARKKTKQERQERQQDASHDKDLWSQNMAVLQQHLHQCEVKRDRLQQLLRGSTCKEDKKQLEEVEWDIEVTKELAKEEEEKYQWVKTQNEERLHEVTKKQEEESKKFLNEAIKQGYVIARIVKCIIEGPAGVGKTYLKLLLLSKKPPTCRTSTGCIDPIRAVSGARIQTVEGDGWLELTEDDLMDLVADAIPLLCDQIACEQELPSKVLEALQQLLPDESDDTSTITQEGPTPTHSSQAQSSSTRSQQPETTPSQSTHLEATSTDSPQRETFPTTKDDSPDTHHQAASSALTPAKQATSAILKKIIDKISSAEEAGHFLRPKLVHFLDSGGQPPFHELIRIFSRHTSVAVLVFRLSEELAAHPTVEYYDETGHLVGIPHPSPLTNEEMLKIMTRSLQTSSTDGQPPKVIIVGTHKDKEDECPNETREEKNKKLYNILHPVMPSQLVFYGEALDELIFPMNTKEPGEEEKRIAAILRNEIEKCSREVMIPIWWYILELILQQLAKSTNRRILSRQECLEIAHTLGFSEKAFEAALNYLHDLNIILYYPKILPNAIFMDCQVILDKLSELIKRSYELREAKQGRQSNDLPKAMGGKWARFRDLGIIAIEFLEEYPKLYVDGLFTPTELVKLLDELLVLAPISRDEYFMPCLLEMLSPTELDKHRVLDGAALPLLLRFPNGWPRSGVYCCLVVFLLNQCQWKVVHPNGAPILISRNCIKFQLPDAPFIVTLIDSFSHFELHMDVRAPQRDCYDMCPAIKDTVIAGIDAASKNLHYNNDKPAIAMLCPHSSDHTPVQSSTSPHAAVVMRYRWWRCTEGDLQGNLSDQHKVWFSPEEKLSTEAVAHHRGSQKTLESSVMPTISKGDKPSLLILKKFPGKQCKFNILERIGKHYTDLGTFLLKDDDGSKVSAIELSKQHNIPPICQEIMSQWLQGKGKVPVTYATLVDCLQDADLTSLAKDIDEILC